MNNAERPLGETQKTKEIIDNFIHYMSHVKGSHFNNVGEMYPLLQGENLFVRREDPQVVAKAFSDELPIEIHNKQGTEPYPNAVEWNYQYGTHGLENAFLEGRTQLNGIVTVIGFKQQHVKKTEVNKIASSVVQPGGKVVDRSHVVSIDGLVPKEDIRFIVMKIPQKLVPNEFLTEEEADRGDDGGKGNPKYVFRGVLFEDIPREDQPLH